MPSQKASVTRRNLAYLGLCSCFVYSNSSSLGLHHFSLFLGNACHEGSHLPHCLDQPRLQVLQTMTNMLSVSVACTGNMDVQEGSHYRLQML